MSAGRVKKEISIICKQDSNNDTSGVSAILAPDDGNLPGDRSGWRHLIGTITGPSGTPYENGVFDVDILIDTEYPFAPPKMRFITKIWHPNVSSQTGAICLGEYYFQCRHNIIMVALNLIQQNDMIIEETVATDANY